MIDYGLAVVLKQLPHDEALLLSFDRRNWWLEIGPAGAFSEGIGAGPEPLDGVVGAQTCVESGRRRHVSGTAEIIAGGADFVIYRIQESLKRLLGKDIAGRDFAVYSDDTFIVSYPRSGNTWTRFLVANLLNPQEEVTFASIENQVPDTEAQSRIHLRRVPRPRFIKSHQYFHPRYRKVVYIVRDPRDVVLSYYDFQRKYRQIEDAYPLASFVSDFVAGRMISASWGTWKENVGSWIYARGGSPDFLLLRYEDMLADTLNQTTRLAEFLGLKPTATLLERAIGRSAADHMRELERTQGQQWVSTKGKRTDIPFVRCATSGAWKTKLPEASVAEIETACGSLMSTLGYELVTRSEQDPREAAATRSGLSIQTSIPRRLAPERH